MSAGFKSILAGVIGRFASNSSSPPPADVLHDADGLNTVPNQRGQNKRLSLGSNEVDNLIGSNTIVNQRGQNKRGGVGKNDVPD